MTYHSDPKRWTESAGDAPELLRGAFEAGSREGPSDLQMRTLALKLAAVGGGATFAAGAATAHASTTAGGGALAAAPIASAGGALTLTKIAVSLALLSAAATGTVLWQRSHLTPSALPARHTQVAERHSIESEANEGLAPSQAAEPVLPAQAPVAAEPALPAGEPAVGAAAAPADLNTDAPERAAVGEPPIAVEPLAEVEPLNEVEPAASDEHTATTARPSRGTARAERHARREANANREPASRAAYVQPSDITQREGDSKRSEIELLRTARLALAAQPREAYRLTEQHRTEYPQGVFTQERDALAVEALLRAGNLALARGLAESFVKRYPSSPHAHRFREAMNLQ
jgi:hypothetical protein